MVLISCLVFCCCAPNTCKTIFELSNNNLVHAATTAGRLQVVYAYIQAFVCRAEGLHDLPAVG